MNPIAAFFKDSLTAVTGFFGGIQTYLIVGAVAIVIGLGAGAYGGYRWEHGEVLKLQLADANLAKVAVQKQADSDTRQYKVDLKAATQEAYAQGALDVPVRIIHERIHDYVTPAQDARVCVTVGVVRVLRAAATGSSPDALALSPGQSDDDCADITASALADNIAAALSTGLKNAEQLNALEAWETANHAAQETPTSENAQ